MAELNGYLLTKEEEKACVELIKEMRFKHDEYISPKYAEPILTLANSLSIEKIPFFIRPLWGGLQIMFPWCNGDAICNKWSYGSESGNVETMNCPWDDDDVTSLTVEDAYIKIVEWYSHR